MLNLFKKSFQELSQEEVQGMLQDKDTVVVDVREAYEYATGHIKGAKLIPLGTLPSRLHELNRDKKIILVCASGARSGRAASFLTKQGYKVYNLRGGMMRWQGKVQK